MDWTTLWKVTLLFTLFGYSLLVIVVFFGGLKNIADMLRELRDGSRDEE